MERPIYCPKTPNANRNGGALPSEKYVFEPIQGAKGYRVVPLEVEAEEVQTSGTERRDPPLKLDSFSRPVVRTWKKIGIRTNGGI